MRKLVVLLIFFFAVVSPKSHAQENKDFKAFAKKEKLLMLKAYGVNDIAGYRKHLDDFLAGYNKLNDKEKKSYSFNLYEANYLMACAYAKARDKKNALDYIVKSKDEDYSELMNDHDLDILRKEPRFIKLLEAAKKKSSSYQPPSEKAKVSSRSNTDYESVMEKFKTFYNKLKADSVDNMFSNPERMKSFLSAEELGRLQKEYGVMISYKYVAQDDGDGQQDVALFKMVFDKSVHMMGISIDKNNKLLNFRFETSSPNIDKLLAKEL